MSKPMTTIAIVGNPNSGKTTLFNGLTGTRQRVGNWPGVTVEKKEGVVGLAGGDAVLVDLPGVYALAACSEDEQIARDYILSGAADVVIDIVDASNLERNLYLTLQLLEMGVPVLLVLNMIDLARQKGVSIDPDALAQSLGCPVVAVSATNQVDINQVRDALSKYAANPPAAGTAVEYSDVIEAAAQGWSADLARVAEDMGTTPRWVAVKLFEQDPWVTERVVAAGALKAADVEAKLAEVEKELGETSDVVLANQRFSFIQSFVSRAVTRVPEPESTSDKIDRVVMHRFWGIPIFLVAMYALFWITMSIGGAFIDFFDMFFGAIFVDGLGAVLGGIGAPEWLVTTLAGGVGEGIRTVATFVPIIGVMFLLLSLLEDSGYMARAAFVMDRLMRWIGLPGKAFVPMLVGFGCTVPAVMATRTLENKRDRFLTVFMTPFMSCGARLPVYALFGAAFFGARAGLMVFSLYLTGIVLAILTGLLLKNTLFKGESGYFVMELPPYHAPRLRAILSYTWHRLRLFVWRAGRVIVAVVMVLSLLNTFGVDGTVGNEDSTNSVLSRIGQTVTPVFTPMGVENDNWPASVAMFVGLFAKEAVVGSLNSLYGQMGWAAEDETPGEEEEAGFDFFGAIGEAFASIPPALAGVVDGLLDPLGITLIAADGDEIAEEVGADAGVYAALQSNFSQGPMQAYAYLLFVLIYFPCVAALGAVIREVGRGYGWLLMGYLTVLAWSVATLFYQVTVGGQMVWIVVSLAVLVGTAALLAWLGRRSSADQGGLMQAKPKIAN